MVRRSFHTLKQLMAGSESRMSLFVLILLSILVLGPLTAVLLQVGEWELLLEVFRKPLWQRALHNSLLLSTGTAILGTLLGTGLAIFRSLYHFPTARWLDTCVWLLFITPSFMLAQGWLLFISHNGIASHLFGLHELSSFMLTPLGLILIMVLSKFPLAYLAVQAALKWQVRDLSHAARLSGASTLRTWLGVRLPLLRPAIMSGLLLVFMDTIGDFGLPASVSAVYRFPTLPYAIYAAIYTSPIRFDMAGTLSFYLVLIIFVCLVLQSYVMKGARYDHLTSRAQIYEPERMGGRSLLAMLANLAFLFVAIGIPIGSTLYISFVHVPSEGFSPSNLTLNHYVDLFHEASSFADSLLLSLKIASTAACAGLLLGLLIAYVLVFANFRFKQVLESLSLISLAVPGIVLGIGYIFFWNQKGLEPFGLLLYGKPQILVLAAIAGSIPVIIRILSGTVSSVPRSMLDVAKLQGASLAQRIFLILMPLIRPSLVTAALAAFGASMFDLAVNSVLFPPGQYTLPVMINKSFENMKFGQAASATMLSGAIVTTIIAVLIKWLNPNKKGANRWLHKWLHRLSSKSRT